MFRIRFNSDIPTPVVLLFCATVIFIIFASYRKLLCGKKTKTFLIFHILAGFLLLCAIFQPELSFSMKTRLKKPVLVLIDTSKSMEAKDRAGISKIQQAKEFLEKKKYFKKYNPVYYLFGSDAKIVNQKDIPLIEANQNSTKIATCLSSIIKNSSDNYSGVILLTDGYENQFISWEEMKKVITIPVYTVGIGEESAKDIGISTILTNSPLYEGEIAKISPIISQKGYDDEKVSVSLKENGKLIQGRTIEITSNFVRLDFEIPSLPEGDYIYEVSVQPGIGETNLENNHFPVLVRVIAPTLHILYVEGNLRWEYKFLKRFIESDKKIEPCCLVRVGESTFQQTGGKTIDVPTNILGKEIFLNNFDIIIFGDIDFSSFSDKDMQNLRNFVEKKGGSVLFLGGENFLKGLKRDVIKDILPVILTGNEAGFIEGPFKPEITEEGKNLPVFENFQYLPILDRMNRCPKPTPAGLVLIKNLESPDNPLVVSTGMPRGRCVIVATDSTWKWCYAARQDEKLAYEQFWARIIRFLCGPDDYLGIGNRVPDINLDKRTFAENEQIHIRFLFTGENSPFNAYIVCPDYSKINLNVENNASIFSSKKDGIYLVCAENKGKINKKEFIITNQGSEIKDPGRDDIYLKKLAEISGGMYFPIENSDGLQKELSSRKTTVKTHLAITRESEKFLIPIIFILLTICWFLRRQSNIL